MALAWRYAARTDVGLVRSRNEDSGYAGPHLLVLADGMGGHAAGNVASSLAVGEMVPLDGEAYGADEAMRLSGAALHAANTALSRATRNDPGLAGMGTTVTALLRTGNKVVLTHIGDSRAYLSRGGVFAQISRDHSYVQALVDEGRISAEEAMHHPQRSLVTRVLTGHEHDEPDLSVREARVGDRYLICSDGLSDYVAPDTIGEVVLHGRDAGSTADRLVELALKAGAPDNVTCIVADVVDPDTDSPPTDPQIVGAAAEHELATTQAMPQTPAAKAAALTREATRPARAAGASGGGPGGGPARAGETSSAGGGVDTDPSAPDAATHDATTPAASPPASAAAADSRPAGTMTLAEETGGPRWIRRFGLLVLVLVLIGGGSYAAYTWSQQQYFVGQANGHVAVYRGVAGSVGSVTLSHVEIETGIAMADLPDFYGSKVRATIDTPSLTAARRTVLDLSGQAVRCARAKASGGSCSTGATG